MEFMLQQGWGMFGLDRDFINDRLASGVILSPRVYTPDQIEQHAQDLRKRGAIVIFDPQFYDPHTDREKLLSFPYWDGLEFDTSTFDNPMASEFCERVMCYQSRNLGVSEGVIPGRYTNSVNEEWLIMHHRFAETAAQLSLGIPIYSTVALGPDVIVSEENLSNVIDEVISYPVDGIYFIFRSPNDRFFISDEGILYNLLCALLSIRLSGKDIMIGYANQQSIIFGAAGVGRIASGNFRNTRQFNPEIFDEQGESVMQRGIWYYHPRSLSDFRVEALRLAFRRGLRELFGPPCDYCRDLLEAPDPGIVRWGEREAFRHFLFELGRQWIGLDRISINDVISRLRSILGEARVSIQELRSRAFVLGERSFEQSLSPTEGALEAFISDRQDDLQRL
jgi:hypothetical protein